MEVSSGNRSRISRTMFVVLVFVSATLCSPHASLSVSAHQCKAWLVQSIPTDMPHLPRVSGVLSTGNNIIYINMLFCFYVCQKCILILGFVFFFFFGLGDVFRWLAQNSSHKLDIIAQYWQLNAQPEDPRSGDYGYSKADMSRFGAAQGSQVYKAIEDAADRNVSIRYNTQLNSMHATFQLFLSIFFI